jgi:hypothetical protein
MASPRLSCTRALLAAYLLCAFTTSLHIAAAAADDPGMSALLEGRYDTAYQYYLAQTSRPENKNSALIYLAQISLLTGALDTAKTHIDTSLEIPPNDAEEYRLAGNIYCNAAQEASLFKARTLVKECSTAYEAATKADPHNARALMAAMAFHFEAPKIAGGSKEKAREYQALLEQVSPEHADTYKVHLLHREGKKDDALKLANTLAEKNFRSLENQYAIAMFYRDNERLTQAKPLFESLAASEYQYDNRWHVVDAALQAGEIYLKEGTDIPKSIAYIERYKSLNNNPRDIHYFWSSWSLAKAYFAAGDIEKFNTWVQQIKSENYAADKAFHKQFEKELRLYQ